MSRADSFHRGSTTVLSALMLVLGVAIVVTTLARGGDLFSARLLMGVLLAAAGGLRLSLQRRTHDRG